MYRDTNSKLRFWVKNPNYNLDKSLDCIILSHIASELAKSPYEKKDNYPCDESEWTND